MQQQIMLSTGCPGLVIYGRRRVGKSTLMKNLEGFLPELIIALQLSMQSAEAFSSLKSFVGMLCLQIKAALGDGPEFNVSETELLNLSRFLDACNQRLSDRDQRLLLTIDEYETLDKKIGEKVFPVDLLAMIRESIQKHRRITWAFAGSHRITELRHAEWTSYLIIARTVEVPMFTADETRLLLTDPLRHSSLWAGREEQRPRYDPMLWGENGIARIHAQVGGWPVLVQLIAETAIEAYYPSAGTIYIICDNAPYYRSKEVREYLETSRVELVFLPPYAPNRQISSNVIGNISRKRFYMTNITKRLTNSKPPARISFPPRKSMRRSYALY
ncbi:MAG: transposase [Methylococcales bacterium]